jgi:hypothetical protein
MLCRFCFFEKKNAEQYFFVVVMRVIREFFKRVDMSPAADGCGVSVIFPESTLLSHVLCWLPSFT